MNITKKLIKLIAETLDFWKKKSSCLASYITYIANRYRQAGIDRSYVHLPRRIPRREFSIYILGLGGGARGLSAVARTARDRAPRLEQPLFLSCNSTWHAHVTSLGPCQNIYEVCSISFAKQIKCTSRCSSPNFFIQSSLYPS